MSPTYESIFKVLKKFPHPLTAREITANAEHEGTTATYGMALHALSQDGGPLQRTRNLETGAFLYSLRDGITLANFIAPPRGPRQVKPPVVEAKIEAPRIIVGVSPAKAITSPAPIRAEEMTRTAPEAPATARVVKPMDEQPNTTSTSQSSNENPGGPKGEADAARPREDAAKVVTINTSPKIDRKSVDVYETIEARLRTNVEQLISSACMSADPVVRGFGVTVKELKAIRDLLRTTKGRDAA